jgi:hypothetical protein
MYLSFMFVMGFYSTSTSIVADVGFCLACKPLKFIQCYLQVLESDMSQWDQKISDLVELGKEMAHEGHFDADNILSASCSCQEK